MIDDKFIQEQVVKLIRADGANEARLNANDGALARVSDEMKSGFERMEEKTAQQVNHIRGEIKMAADRQERQREDDMAAIAERIDKLGASGIAFRTQLTRVGWAIIAAVIAAAAAQTTLAPQVAGMAAGAIQRFQTQP